MAPVLVVEQLQKHYGNHKAVKDVSFSVEAGEIFGIVGPNGAGKTSSVECIIGLRPATAGTIQILGRDLKQHGQYIRSKIGVQLQQATLPDRLTVAEALQLFGSFYPQARPWQKVLDEWGLAEQAKTAFANLSGGQKQRLFIALSLIHDPEIVFLDELTTGLDPQARRITWNLIQDVRNRGKTVVLVTHFMEEVERLCDRIAVIDQGTVIALDRPDRMIAAYQHDLRQQPAPSRDLPHPERVTFEDVFLRLIGQPAH